MGPRRAAIIGGVVGLAVGALLAVLRAIAGPESITVDEINFRDGLELAFAPSMPYVQSALNGSRGDVVWACAGTTVFNGLLYAGLGACLAVARRWKPLLIAALAVWVVGWLVLGALPVPQH